MICSVTDKVVSVLGVVWIDIVPDEILVLSDSDGTLVFVIVVLFGMDAVVDGITVVVVNVVGVVVVVENPIEVV